MENDYKSPGGTLPLFCYNKVILRQEDVFIRAPGAETIQFNLFLEPHTRCGVYEIHTLKGQKQSFGGTKQAA